MFNLESLDGSLLDLFLFGANFYFFFSKYITESLVFFQCSLLKLSICEKILGLVKANIVTSQYNEYNNDL